jgi:hypothetical protein
MVHRVDMVFVIAHQDLVLVIEATLEANLWVGSSGPAAVAAAFEEYSRPSNHI